MMVLMVLALLGLPFASASAVIPELSAALVEQEINRAISTFQSGGLRIPAGSRCSDLLREASRDLGRAMTHEEISDNVADILKETEELLEPVPFAPPRPASPSFNCLTGDMKVRTPGGEVRIASLREGDLLLSVEIGTGRIVTNPIAKIKATPGQAYGRLISLARPIEATGLHRFLTGDGRREEDFVAIADVPTNGPLYSVDLEGGRLRPVPRGEYVCDAGVGTVYDIRMTGEPRNYIVEDILVHNSKF